MLFRFAKLQRMEIEFVWAASAGPKTIQPSCVFCSIGSATVPLCMSGSIRCGIMSTPISRSMRPDLMKWESAKDNLWRCLQNLMLTFCLGKWPVSDRRMRAEDTKALKSDPEHEIMVKSVLCLHWLCEVLPIPVISARTGCRLSLSAWTMFSVIREASEPWSMRART